MVDVFATIMKALVVGDLPTFLYIAYLLPGDGVQVTLFPFAKYSFSKSDLFFRLYGVCSQELVLAPKVIINDLIQLSNICEHGNKFDIVHLNSRFEILLLRATRYLDSVLTERTAIYFEGAFQGQYSVFGNSSAVEHLYKHPFTNSYYFQRKLNEYKERETAEMDVTVKSAEGNFDQFEVGGKVEGFEGRLTHMPKQRPHYLKSDLSHLFKANLHSIFKSDLRQLFYLSVLGQHPIQVYMVRISDDNESVDSKLEELVNGTEELTYSDFHDCTDEIKDRRISSLVEPAIPKPSSTKQRCLPLGISLHPTDQHFKSMESSTMASPELVPEHVLLSNIIAQLKMLSPPNLEKIKRELLEPSQSPTSHSSLSSLSKHSKTKFYRPPAISNKNTPSEKLKESQIQLLESLQSTGVITTNRYGEWESSSSYNSGESSQSSTRSRQRSRLESEQSQKR